MLGVALVSRGGRRPLRDGLSLRGLIRLVRQPDWCASRRPLRDGLSLRGYRGDHDQGRYKRRRPLRDGLSLRDQKLIHLVLLSGSRRPLRDGLSLRVVGMAALRPEAYASPSFTGRPFIEGLTSSRQRCASPQGRRPLRDGLSLRVFALGLCVDECDGRRPLRDGLSLRGDYPGLPLSAKDSRRPLRDGLSLRDLFLDHPALAPAESPSFTGRPFIEGTQLMSDQNANSVAVLYGTAFH